MESGTLKGKTALVTGAAKRIGAAIAAVLAERGTHVVIHYNRSEAEALQLAKDIMDRGGHASTVQGGLDDAHDVERLMETAIQECGKVDILVNNASIFNEMKFMDSTDAGVWENMMINAMAPMFLAQRFAAQGMSGAIINMIDTMVMDYDRKHVPYHISKKTLHVLTKIMAVEFAPTIRVNAVAPGLILPPEGQDEAYLARLASSNPLNRYGNTGDIVRAVLYLLESDFVTGQTLYVDGGRHLRGHMYE